MTELRDYQGEATVFLFPRRRGCVVAPAGSGKTVIAAHAAANAACRVWAEHKRTVALAWLCNTIEQKQQAIAALQSVECSVPVDILVECYAAQPDLSQMDIVIVDECHHVPAETLGKLLSNVKPDAILYGFTATPEHSDPLRNAAVAAMFKEFFFIDRARVEASGHLIKGQTFFIDCDVPGQFDDQIKLQTDIEVDQRCSKFPRISDPRYFQLRVRWKSAVNELVRLKGAAFVKAMKAGTYNEPHPPDTEALLAATCEAYDAMTNFVRDFHRRRAQWQITQEVMQANATRNAAAACYANSQASAGESVLVLVASIEHGLKLCEVMPGAVCVHSKLPKKLRAEYIESLRSGMRKILVATSLADEGLDVPRASRLILVAGGRSAGKLEQRAGRVLRPFAGKNGGVIYDFLDRGATFAHAQAKARMRVYETLGYSPEIIFTNSLAVPEKPAIVNIS